MSSPDADMECKAVATLLIDYLERCLPPDQQEEMESHFHSCRECRDFLDGYSSTVTLIQNLRRDAVQIPEPVRDRLRQFLKKHRALA
jgi:predicted anti-sigma-YlaC factor YlaD